MLQVCTCICVCVQHVSGWEDRDAVLQIFAMSFHGLQAPVSRSERDRPGELFGIAIPKPDMPT